MPQNDPYYEWLVDLVYFNNSFNYERLFEKLYLTDYRYVFELDSNRAKAGENMRVQYAYEEGIYVDEMPSSICNVLEMLVALSKRLSDTYGRTPGDWFEELLTNLDILTYDDDHFDEAAVERIIDDWMDHEYSENGEGSIFPLYGYSGDATRLDLWSQMNIYLNEGR